MTSWGNGKRFLIWNLETSKPVCNHSMIKPQFQVTSGVRVATGGLLGGGRTQLVCSGQKEESYKWSDKCTVWPKLNSPNWHNNVKENERGSKPGFWRGYFIDHRWRFQIPRLAFLSNMVLHRWVQQWRQGAGYNLIWKAEQWIHTLTRFAAGGFWPQCHNSVAFRQTRCHFQQANEVNLVLWHSFPKMDCWIRSDPGEKQAYLWSHRGFPDCALAPDSLDLCNN